MSFRRKQSAPDMDVKRGVCERCGRGWKDSDTSVTKKKTRFNTFKSTLKRMKKENKLPTNFTSKFKRAEKETAEEPPPLETAEVKPKAVYNEPPPEDLPLAAAPGESYLNEVNINGNEEIQTPSDVAGSGCLG